MASFLIWLIQYHQNLFHHTEETQKEIYHYLQGIKKNTTCDGNIHELVVSGT